MAEPDAEVERKPRHGPPPDVQLAFPALVEVRRQLVRADVVVPQAEEVALRVVQVVRLEEEQEAVAAEMRGEPIDSASFSRCFE